MGVLNDMFNTVLDQTDVWYKQKLVGNSGGIIYYPDGTATIPDRTPVSVWDKLGNIVNTGIDIYKNIKSIKGNKTQTTVSQPSGQIRTPLYAYAGSEKTVNKWQSQGNILEGKDVAGAIKNLSQADRLTSRVEDISKQARVTGYIIVGGLIFLGIVLLARRR